MIIKAITGLGHTLGLEMVTKSVERDVDVQTLQKVGCDELQGFYFAGPMPPELFAETFAAHRAAVA